MAFADPRGDQLLVLQTNPGALLSLDTSLGDSGEPVDVPSAPPVEICAEPSSMKIYTEYARTEAGDRLPSQRYAIISCFRAAMVYVVDLEALRVVDAVVVGTGPHDIAIDEAREVAYVINNLESSISVIDLSRRRATRFQELARLGLQDPFSQ
jgi:DNA-binding beta-propeller fold protein YncE